jgi:hypothetical protein
MVGMRNIGNLEAYLGKTLGLLCEIQLSAVPHLKSLPVYLKNSFSFTLLKIEGVDYLGVEPLGDVKGSVLLSSTKRLKELTGISTLVILPQIDTNLRRTLISNKIDFVVPERQIYLPSLCMYLNERGLGISIADKVVLSPSAQALLLYHLQVHSLEKLTLKEIAPLLDYSAKTISVITSELIKTTICTLESQGRSKLLHFTQSGKELWKTVAPLLESPIANIYYINELPNELKEVAKMSFDSALSYYTFLAETKQQTVAINKRNSLISHLLDIGELHPTEGSIRVELWKYNPALLSDSPFVDKLSLALCYKGNNDERVNKELNQLIDNMEW